MKQNLSMNFGNGVISQKSSQAQYVKNSLKNREKNNPSEIKKFCEEDFRVKSILNLSQSINS